MKNLNLIKRLWTDSHEKQSPQRFARFAAMLIMLFTLGVGQMWADNGDFYNVSMSYKFEDNDWAWIEGSDNGTGESRDVGTLSSGTLKVGDVYLKCWDDWGSNFKSEGGQMCYTNKGGDTQYLTGFTRSSKYGNEGNNYDYHKTSCDLTIASYDQASGSFALECWYQTWGSNWGDRYFPKSSGHYTLNYKIAPPAVKEGNNFTVTPSNLISGTGTSSDPFIIAYGSSTTFKVTATKHHTDANSKLKVSWNNGSTWSTGSTASTTELTSSSFTPDGTKRSITIKVKFNNSTASLDGAVSSRTIHYIQQTPGLTVAAGSHGKVRKSTGDSWTTSALISPVAAGTAYNIYAKADDYYDFSSWSSSDATHTTFGSSTSASTTATLSAGYGAVTTVTANFVEHPYTITIVGGTEASTTAKVATTGTATAKAPFGMHFTGWTVPNSNFTLVGCTTSSETITFNATAAGTVTANFEQTHAYIEGRFHIWNPSRSGNWTNTFNSGDWQEDSRNIEFSYDAVNHYYYLHTYAKPSELTSQISNLDPWFYIKSSPSTSSWTGATVNRPHASGDSNQQLTAAGEANKKSADGTSGSNSFRFNSSDQSGYVVIGFKKFGITNDPYIYYWLEQRLQYNGNGNTGGSAPTGTYGNDTYHATNASITAPANTYTKTGYSFAGWKKNNAGALISAGSSVTMDADVILYAQWTENTHNVSVSANAGGSVSPSGTVAVKQVTGTSITATPDADHAFLNWSISGGGITPTSSSTKTQTFKATTTGGTIAANFQNRWIMKGSGGVFGDWNTDKELSKSATNTYSTTLALVAGTAYSFKVYDRHTAKWYGKTSTTITKDVGELTKNIAIVEGAGNTYNLHFTPAVSGNYTFTYNSSTGNLTIGWPDVNQLQIYTAPGHAAAVGNWDWTSTAGSVSSKTFTLNKNTRYTFKVVYHSDFYGFNNNSDMTIDDNTNWRLYDESVGAGYQNANMYSPVAGSYTFSFNSDYVSGSDHLTVISVTYPTAYTITFGAGAINGSNSAISASASPSFSSGDYVLAETDVTFSKGTTKTGYNWKGWYSNNDGTGTCHSSTDGSLSWTATRTGNISVYACYTYKTYTVTLDMQSSAEGYGSGSNRNVTTTYNTTLPSAGALPTAANGYAFMGFYTATGGRGTRFIDASGNWATSVTDTISAGKWVLDAGTTLYAYYKKAEITAVELNETMFDPVAAGDDGYVVANPTIAPNPTGDHIICWELLYDNDNPVTGHNAIEYPDGSHPNRVKFSIAGLAAGGYKIKTTLRTGSSCAGGTLLDTRVTTFQIANAFTVTVEYKDSEGNTIAASTTSPGKALESTDITAPDLIGYTFSTWQLGEGMSTEEALTTKTDFSYTTTFNSTLTAVYAKKRMIYFNNTLGWESVYVYFYKNDSYWQTVSPYNGSGANTTYTWTNTPYSEGLHGQMQPISEGSNIYYFDAEAAGVNASYDDVVFTEAEQHGEGYFHDTKAVRRGDYKTSLPMFVPADEQTADVHNKTNYYNKGYWMNYPENTGYVLHIYNSKTYGASDGLMSIPFEYTVDKTMPMSLTVELAGGKEYGFEIHRADSKIYGTDTKVMKNGDSGDGGAGWALTENQRTGLLTSVAGDYTFTLSYGEKSGDYHFLAGVHYPVAANDYRVVYNDRVAWSLGSAHDASWYHPSRAIEKKDGAEDIVSFYVSKEEGASASMKFQYASSVSGEGVVTWSDVDGGSISLSDITESGVYNFYLSQAAGSITVDSIRPYTGQYYIRSQAVSGGWDNYRVGSDHKMTYSEFSESAANTFGEKFSHYKAKWCPRNTNIAFAIANDYSMCISDTLKQDVGNPYSNTDADGKLNNDGNPGHDGSNAYLDPNSANVRFMWNRKTNKISRAYVASSTSTEARFLVLQGSGTANANIFDENGGALSANPPGANATLLRDDQNWIYEITVKANPSALVKLYATYKGQTQYFRGTSDPGFEKGTSAVELLGGTSSSTKYSVRVVYDFKTNRLVTAWQPTGTTEEIEGVLNINADVMVIRKHHESAQCITFANDESALNGVKTVYGVMQFNRWILNNREHPEDDTPEHCADVSAIASYHRPLAIGDQKSIYERSHYYISFPFDVKLSDVFGFGQYWNEWYIEWYDGLTRAQNGYWIDSPSNWKYVTPEEKDNFVLKANQGYILGLDMDYMQATDFTFWSNKNTTIELYFPSTVSLETLKSTEVTIPALNTIEGDPYRCTINRENGDDGDRRIKDSYWRCIGVPSFNMYNSALKDGEGNTIEWKDDYEWKEDDAAFPFIYLWNKADNTITPQATSEFSFQPMHAYLVQNGGAIVWSAVSAKPSSIVARQRNTEPEEYNWRLELQQNNQMIDRTYIRMKDLESVTDGFDFGQDMSKEFNKKRSAIFSFIGTEKVAANSMTVHTEQTTIVPLGLDIKSAGEYVISLPEGTNGVGVVLVDSITGTRTNLALSDYTVTLGKGDLSDRFMLEIAPIKQMPTDIENVQGDNVQGTKVRKVMVDGILYIVKDGKVFDARGAKVK